MDDVCIGGTDPSSDYDGMRVQNYKVMSRSTWENGEKVRLHVLKGVYLWYAHQAEFHL